MQNVHTRHAINVPICLPTSPQIPLIASSPYPALHTLHRSEDSTLTLTVYPLPPTTRPKVSIHISTPSPTTPTGLTPLADSLVLTLRSGEIYTINTAAASAQVVGDVTDPDPARSGVLAAAASPDGNVLAIVSPLSLTLLDASLSFVKEIPHPELASHAALVWRSDGEFLTVVLRTVGNGVQAYVVDRGCDSKADFDIDAELAGLAVCVDWEPRSGGLIAISGPGESITFFERNGQRHRRSDFSIVANGTPKVLRWSPDARFLAVAAEENEDQGEGDAWRVAFYARSNFRWYCKKRVILKHRVIAIVWDEDDMGVVTVVTEHVVLTMCVRSIPATVALSPSSAVAAVVDGASVDLTDFAQAVIPPPMSHACMPCGEDIVAVSAARGGAGFCFLMADGTLEWMLFRQQAWPAPNPTGVNNVTVSGIRGRITLWHGSDNGTLPEELRMPLMPSQSCAVIVAPCDTWKDAKECEPSDELKLYKLSSGTDGNNEWGDDCRLVVDGRVEAVGHSWEHMAIVVVSSKGVLMRVGVDEFSGGLMEMSRVEGVSECVKWVQDVQTRRGRVLTLLLDEEGSLDVVEMGSSRRLSVSKECTSACVHEGFLVLTTRSHLLYCMLLDTTESLSSSMNKGCIPSIVDALDSAEAFPKVAEGHGATRPIDRGSLIITPLPGKTDIILQAPRGNLETIAPRPIVFEVVDRLAKERKYGKVFELCRRQRVDMNFLVDADYDGFLAHVTEFVYQVRQPSHLSVFLNLLKGEAKRVNTVCDAIVKELKDQPDAAKFTTAILTGLIRRDPSDFVGALEEVSKARHRSVEEGSSAIDYLFVLAKDEGKVYEEALGTYDLSLAAFVAESSQMDPASYMQELHTFRGAEENERRHLIDSKLRRYDKALRHLYACGETMFGECVKMCHEHALYETGIALFADNAEIRSGLVDGYGRHLRDVGKYESAGAAFLEGGNWKMAIECYRLGSKWQLALQAVGRCADLSVEERREVYVGIADDLAERGQMIECARIRSGLVGDLEGALEALSVGSEWEAAFEALITYEENGGVERYERREEGWRMVKNAVAEGGENLLSTLRENRTKLHERGNRLKTLRENNRKLREGMTAGGQGGDGAESDSFSATSASSIGSNLSDVTFTSKISATSLYSTAMTAATSSGIGGFNGPLSSAKLEKQALRRQQRASKKRIREGHPREMEYLAGYLKKLVPGEYLRERVAKTVRALVVVGKAEAARELLNEMRLLVEEAMTLPEDVVEEDVQQQIRNDRTWDDITPTLTVLSAGEAH